MGKWKPKYATCFIMIRVLAFIPVVEFRGHSFLDAVKSCDMGRVKKTIDQDLLNFKHPYTHDTALVSLLDSSLS